MPDDPVCSICGEPGGNAERLYHYIRDMIALGLESGWAHHGCVRRARRARLAERPRRKVARG